MTDIPRTKQHRGVAIIALVLAAVMFHVDVESRTVEDVLDGAQSQPVESWQMTGRGGVHASSSTLHRLTQSGPVTDLQYTDELTIVWEEAKLEPLEGPGTSYNITLNLALTIRHSMPVLGEFGGLITNIVDVAGSMSAVGSDNPMSIRIDNRGMWVAQFVHSDSAGPNHLAIIIPFALYGQTMGPPLAQSVMVARIDMSDSSAPFVQKVVFQPLVEAALKQVSGDLSHAVSASTLATQTPPATVGGRFESQVSVIEMSSLSEDGHVMDFFSETGKEVFGCGAQQQMSIKFDSPGFAKGNALLSAPYTLHLQYAPSLAYQSEGESYSRLEPLSGALVVHRANGDQIVDISPGHHGSVSSHVTLVGDRLKFVLGVTLSEIGREPALAKMVISCSSGPVRTVCDGLTLSDAVDSNDVVISRRLLSDLFDNPALVQAPGSYAVVARAHPGDCTFTCPTCKVEGCLPNAGICAVSGAPLGCDAGCVYTTKETPQCCHSTGKFCCVEKCGVQK